MSMLDKFRRPATSTSIHRSDGSVATESASRATSPRTTSPRAPRSSFERGHRLVGSLQRLSLSLSGPNSNTFGDFLTLEPEEIEEAQPIQSPALSQQSRIEENSHSTHASSSRAQPRQTLEVPSIQEEEDHAENQDASLKPKTQQRFSLLKFRHASDSQLSSRFKQSAKGSSDGMPTPKIITTAPTSTRLEEPKKKKSKTVLGRSLSPFRRSQIVHSGDGINATTDPESATTGAVMESDSIGRPSRDLREHRIHFEDHVHKDGNRVSLDPPAYGDESTSSLAIPVSTRLSESGGSEGSSGSHKIYARTTTTHTISTTTTFFRLKRKKKDKGPLFPLPERFPRPGSATASAASATDLTPRRSISPTRRSTQNVHFELGDGEVLSPSPSPTHSLSAITNAPLGSPGPAIVRKHSTMSNHSGTSTPSLSLMPPRLGARGRSSTMGSLGKSDQPPSGRTSTSTNGRRSFGDLLSFSHRLRQNSVPPRSGANRSPSTPGSKSNSMQIARESEPELAYPPRDPADTPSTYLEKLEAAVPRGSMATILCKSEDEFAKTCLRKYMRGFAYFQESIDMSVRKMLMEVELPKETQQIDRLLGGFADRYHECNPGIFASADEASIVAFSILLLHSDNHNKNNKHKMQKSDYVKNTQHGQVQVSSDVLECFYDNICYTPFIHFEDDIAVHSHRLSAPKPKKSLIRTKSFESLRGQVDPYTLILDNKLDLLRPPLREVIDTEDTYSSTGTLKNANSNDHHKLFVQSAVLQIVSARSRPDAFMTQATISNPAEAQAGLVSIKIAKVGLLWRKDLKKKKAARAWQEWGAILTDSKLYFFRDLSWVKKLIAQYDTHVKSASATRRHHALIFKPALTAFEPDALMAMDDSVALMDSSYKKHKNAFTFIKHGGFEEVFLANSEAEMNDWIGKLNYAATFRTAGVRMRGLLGTNYEGRHLLRKDSDLSTVNGDSSNEQAALKKQDPHIAWEILFYRHQLIQEKISGYEDKLSQIKAELEQLLRNARHLLLQLPIQPKTREALVLAAGRMAAKLKWARVEYWRAQTHADILKQDLEAEGVSNFPGPKTSNVVTPLKTTPKTIGQNAAGETSDLVLSPITPTASTARRPSQTVLDQITIGETSVEDHLSPAASPLVAQEQSKAQSESQSRSPSIRRQPSIVSSLHSKQAQHSVLTHEDDGEERALREAGLLGIEGEVRDSKRRGSDSDKDRYATASPTSEQIKDRATSVRRSLQRTLRDASHVHHTPSHHRRKGKESGSSVAVTEDGKSIVSGEAEELKRGTGSFILHGKKASVITVSPEWQSMSKEERLRSRQAAAVDGKVLVEETVLTEDRSDNGRSTSEASGPSSSVNMAYLPVHDYFVSATSSRRTSADTGSGDEVNKRPIMHRLITK